MQNWEFLQNALGRWFWRHTHANGHETTSTRDFATRAECMADAIRGVYTAARGGAERKLRDTEKHHPL